MVMSKITIYLLKSYYPTKAKTWIFGGDANNLYGHSVMQTLPFKIIDWFDPEKINLEIYSDHSPIRYLLKVDLDYPHELQDLHNDFPLAAERIKVTKEMLCKYQFQRCIKRKYTLHQKI